MYGTYTSCVVCGLVGNDVDVRDVNGLKIIKFSLAVKEYQKDAQGGSVTEWHNIVGFGDRFSKITQFIVKGAMITAIGAIRNRSFQDESGGKRRYTEIVADRIELGKIDKKEEQTNKSNESYDNIDTTF